jgi:DNA repair protein NreA
MSLSPAHPKVASEPPLPGVASDPALIWSIPGLREDPTMCLRCRSAQLLCGKPVCPLLIRYNALGRTLPMLGNKDWDGSTPPGLFIGRIGYPYVSVGPLLAPEHGDTLLYDTPERWVGRPLPEIVGYRTSLVRGTSPVKVSDAEKPLKLVQDLQLISLASDSAETEAHFRRAPRIRLELSDEAPPFGASAPLEGFKAEVRKVDARLQRATDDVHASARVGVAELYDRDVPVSRIQRAFSAGTLGRRGHRKFVPTRWSITAVDDVLSKDNLERVRYLPEVSEWSLYSLKALGDRWFILFLPGAWRYESIEAWYPGTLWNPLGEEVVMIGDHEGHLGRTTYASIGGCYYAARLAVSEHLERIGRQAGVAILRETHPDQVMPLGVWNVREHVREALRHAPEVLPTYEDVVRRISTFFEIPVGRWLRQCALLRDWRTQRRLDDFA